MISICVYVFYISGTVWDTVILISADYLTKYSNLIPNAICAIKRNFIYYLL